jgi:hypothetical protein
MTGEQFGGIVRALVTFAAGFLVAKGVGDAGMWQIVGGSLATIAASVWSWYSNKPAAPAA